MRRFLLLTVACLAGAGGCAAQMDPIYYSHGMLNGRWWRANPEMLQLAFLTGYAEGLSLAEQTVASGRPVSWRGVWFPTTATFGEIQEGLNSFYAAPENRSITFFVAIQLLRDKMAGASQAKIDSQIESWREIYADVRAQPIRP
jgi:hypothetical protein